MLNDFMALEAGDWVVQNGANSAVGEAVIQIAAAKGLKTVNLVRDRPNIEELKQRLHAIGATQVLTYDDLADKTIREKLKEWTGGRGIRLGLNCVGAILLLQGLSNRRIEYSHFLRWRCCNFNGAASWD